MFRLSLMALCMVFSMTAMAGKSMRVTDKVIVGLYKDATLQGDAMILVRTDAPLEVIKAQKKVTLVKTSDGTTGWIKNTYITSKKSSRLQLIDIQIRYRKSQEKLKAAELHVAKLKKQIKQLKAQKSTANKSPSRKELASLKSELRKARAEIANLKSNKGNKGGSGKSAKQDKLVEEITALQTTVTTLEAQLASEKSKNGAAEKDQTSAIQPLSTIHVMEPSEALSELQKENTVLRQKISKIAGIAGAQGTVRIPWVEDISILWVVVVLAALLLLGFFGGITWLDFRQRRRHGGFRI